MESDSRCDKLTVRLQHRSMNFVRTAAKNGYALAVAREGGIERAIRAVAGEREIVVPIGIRSACGDYPAVGLYEHGVSEIRVAGKIGSELAGSSEGRI